MKSGSGERAAVAGYRAQYKMAALRVLRSMRTRALTEIFLADPEAGTLDDLQLGFVNELHAYQFKSSNDGSKRFTLGDLKSELLGLVAGWEQIVSRESDSGRTVVAHYVCTYGPASHRSIVPTQVPKGVPSSFKAFLDSVWTPINRGAIESRDAIADHFLTTWDELQEHSGLSSDDFFKFARAIRFELATGSPELGSSDARLDPDIDEIYDRLLGVLEAIVASPEKTVRLTLRELVGKLGWSGRMNQLVGHELQIDRLRYSPNQASKAALEGALDANDSGYFALLGSPGTGKSYLLTDVLGSSDISHAKFYAYLPDELVGASTRVSATTFLHDVVLQLEQRDLVVGDAPPSNDVSTLESRFAAQLELAAERGEKVTILVDGLDHAGRVPDAGPSFLDVLPQPPLPDGVRIVLGSQHLRGLAPKIKSQLAREGRTVEVTPLSDATVTRVAEMSGLDLSQPELQQLIVSAAGHPLALGMLMNGLAEQSLGDRLLWLKSQPRLIDGHVDALYRGYWGEIESDNSLVDLLARMSRWRRSIDPLWLANGETKVRQQMRPIEHLFRKEAGDRWFFFHESFRLFLIQATVADQNGEVDEALSRQYSREVANLCENADEHDSRRFEELHHRLRAAEYERALSLLAPSQIRQQIEGLRSIPLIQEDLRDATSALRASCDPLTLTRLSISAAEIGQRSYHFESSAPLAPALVAAGLTREAIDWLRTDTALLADQTSALRTSRALAEAGEGEEAARLFRLATPRDLLSGDDRLDAALGEESEVLFAWAEVAPEFADINEVVASLSALAEKAEQDGIDSEMLRFQRAELCWKLAIGYDRQGDPEGADRVIAELGGEPAEEAFRWRFKVWRSLAQDAGSELAGLVDQMPKFAVHQRFDLELGEALMLTNQLGLAKSVTERIDAPEFPEPRYSGARGLGTFRPIFRWSRLRAAAGLPDEQLPSRKSHDEEGRDVAWLDGTRAIMNIASLEGRIRAGNAPAPNTISGILEPLDDAIEGAWIMSSGLSDLTLARTELLVELISTLKDSSQEVRAEITEYLSQRIEWQSVKNWREESQSVIPAMHSAGLIGEAEASSLLLRVEDGLGASLDPISAVDIWIGQADAWTKLQLFENSRRCLKNAVRATLAVGWRKDEQLSHWLRVLESKFMASSDGRGFGTWLATALAGLETTTEGDAGHWAGRELIGALSEHPAEAAAVSRYLAATGVVPNIEAFADAISVLGKNGDDLAWLALEALIGASSSSYWGPISFVVSHTPKDEILSRSESLRSWIETSALPELRTEWLQELDEVSRPTAEANEGKQHPSDQGVNERLDEIRASTGNFSDWSKLGPLGIETRNAMEIAIPTLDLSEAKSLAVELRSRRSDGRILVLTAERLHDLGQAREVADLARDVLANAEPLAWLRYWGGAKQRASKLLLATEEADKARAEVYSQLADDCVSEPHLLGAVASALPELLHILGAGSRRPEIDKEVIDFLHELLDDVSVAYGPESPNTDAPGEALLWLVAEMATTGSPRSSLRTLSARALARQVNSGSLSAAIASVRAASFDSLASVELVAATDWIPSEGELRELMAVAPTKQVKQEIASKLDRQRASSPAQTSSTLSIDPVQRPTEILRIDAGGDDDWLSRTQFESTAPTPEDVLPETLDGMLVLAEYSHFKRLSREKPIEIRASSVMPVDSAMPIFASEDTPRVAQSSFVTKRIEHDAGGPFCNLSLHPEIASTYGFIGSTFEQEISTLDGRFVCEKRWWRDGVWADDLQSAGSKHEVCEGWLVLVSRALIERIAADFGPLQRSLSVARTYEGREIYESFATCKIE